ncbi:efflux transporter outer membrane subunit [Sphingorhabdus sp. Alg231-15]|uniref:efflux transporter outer membrane subunit n=1 Tax=Sphingorhabdus sp. Alg231-15 TaxID=1922222 RepID=UPI000D54E068
MKKPMRMVALSVSLVALSACASLSTDADIQQAAQASLPSLPDQWLVDGATPGEVQIGWIDRIVDPLLSELVREAQINNRDIQAAAANVEASRALARQARSALFPSVDANFNADRTGRFKGPIPDVSQYTLTLQAQWEADLWGRVRSGSQAAYASTQAVEADFRFAQYALAQAVAASYFACLEAQLQIGVAEETVAALAEIDRIVRVRYREGFASSQDTAIAASDLASASDSLENARGGARLARRSLEVLLGRYPGDQIELKTGLPITPDTPAAGIPSNLLERRPDIIAAERRVAAAFASLDQSKAARLPLVTLTGNLGGASNDLTDILNGPNLIWSIIGNVLQPIFDGGLRDAAVDEADANQRVAISSYASAALNALQEVENGLDQTQVLRKRQQILQDAADKSTTAYRLTELQYKEGETDLIDVLNIQQRLFAAQRDLVSVKRQRIDQWMALNLALGGDWQPTEE